MRYHRFPAWAAVTIVFLLLAPGAFAQHKHGPTKEQCLAELAATVKPGQECVEAGCYIIPVDQIMTPEARAGFGETAVNWTGGYVYYTFNPNNMTEYKKQQFRNAAENWSDVAAVAFYELPYGNVGATNYIEVRDSATVNNSHVGMIGGMQVINIFNWNYEYIITHEIGHALGLWHEQQRSDRDSYVTVLDDNVVDGAEINFAKFNLNPEGTTYDFESVMHYGRTAFSIDTATLNTIEPLAQYSQFLNVMGQRNYLSPGDIAGMQSRYGDRVMALAPDVTPPGGSFDASQVTLSLQLAPDHDNNFSIYRYTTDGSEPEEYSTPWFPDNTVILRNSASFKIRQFHPLREPSNTTTRVFNLAQATPQAATPVISPGTGTYNQPHSVTISTSTSGAQIYYTTNGTNPTQSSTPYSGPISVDAGETTIRAKAYTAGHDPSEIASETYEVLPVTLPSPTIYPNSGTFSGSVNVYMGSTVLGAELRFTTDGTDPDQNSLLFNEPVLLTQDTMVKARIYLDGYAPSAIASADYIVVGTAPTPVINPNGGNFTGDQPITITTTNPSATIRYTTNGAEPTDYSNTYTSPFMLPFGTHTVKAKSFLGAATPSSTATAEFTIFNPDIDDVSPPYFDPVTPQHIEEVEVSMFCDTEGADIYYTIGDNFAPAEPTTSDQLYSMPFTLGKPTAGARWFIRAKAFKTGFTPSSIVQKNYEVIVASGTIAPPTINPDGGTFNNAITVTFASTTTPPTTGIRYYSTTDGSEPFVPDPPNAGDETINLSKSATVGAIAYRDFFGASTSTSAEFLFVCSDPVFDPVEAGHYETVEVTLNSDTTGGGTRIRYTLDGSDPIDGDPSILYSGPFQLGLGTHVVKARVFRNNFDPSEITTMAYAVTETPVSPLVTTQPQSQAVDQGEDVTFTVVATGVPDPSYEWMKDSMTIAGATESSLFIPNAQPEDAANYAVRVYNEAGEDTSNEAVLTVNVLQTPTPTVTPTDTATATPTETVTATITLTPTPTDQATITVTPTATEAVTPTGTLTLTPTSTTTITPTTTDAPTPTESGTPTPSPTNGGTLTPTTTATATSTASPTPTATGTPSPTPSPSPTPQMLFWVFDNNGAADYRINSQNDVSPPIYSGPFPANDPTLSLVIGSRYEVEVLNPGIHPLHIISRLDDSAGNDTVLLAMGSSTGSMEDDAGVNWTDDGNGNIAFTLTESLYEAMTIGEGIPAYRCGIHVSNMRGDFSISGPPPTVEELVEALLGNGTADGLDVNGDQILDSADIPALY